MKNNNVEISKLILTVKENLVAVKESGVKEIRLHESQSNSSKVAALEAFKIVLNGIENSIGVETSKLPSVVTHVFLPDVIYKPLEKGTINSYIRCGKTRNGSDLSLEEVKLYNEVLDLYLAKYKNIVIRNSDFKALDVLDEKTVKNEIRDLYSKLTKKLKEQASKPQVIIQQPVAPVMSESSKKTLDMLNEKLQEAIMNGDFDAMDKFTDLINKFEAKSMSAPTQVSRTQEVVKEEVEVDEEVEVEEKTLINDKDSVKDTFTVMGDSGVSINMSKSDNVSAALEMLKNAE